MPTEVEETARSKHNERLPYRHNVMALNFHYRQICQATESKAEPIRDNEVDNVGADLNNLLTNGRLEKAIETHLCIKSIVFQI